MKKVDLLYDFDPLFDLSISTSFSTMQRVSSTAFQAPRAKPFGYPHSKEASRGRE